jgi:hypothetical protein
MSAETRIPHDEACDGDIAAMGHANISFAVAARPQN